jgi:hypothetical protein
MKWQHLFVLACVVAVGMSSAKAQERTGAQFEVTIDGSIVARPEMSVLSGGEGRLELSEAQVTPGDGVRNQTGNERV